VLLPFGRAIVFGAPGWYSVASPFRLAVKL